MSTFDGYFREFNQLIRADNFTNSQSNSNSILYLLSHLHSDHTNGLDTFINHQNQSDEEVFIYCSKITKDSILNTKTFQQRYPNITSKSKSKKSKQYKFENLRDHQNILKALPLKKPIEILLRSTSSNLNDQFKCCLTLFDANHCPGSVMFLIQMWNKSILYTGDIRAEPWWIESLTKESILSPFIDFNHSNQFISNHPIHNQITLDNIYLDTSGLVYKKNVLTKEHAILSTLKLMSFYPDHTIFFINTWTWGWEELLERISIHFQTLIHVDQYKFDLYTQSSFRKYYPLLSSKITLDSKSTRFHACERKQRCHECVDERYLNQYQPHEHHHEKGLKERKLFNRRVVTVNPMEIDDQKWLKIKLQLEFEIKLAIEEEKKKSIQKQDLWPTLIISPFTRHSSFNELHKFVSIFKPNTLFPNTTSPKKGFIEYYLLPILFQSVLSNGSIQRLEKEIKDYIDDYSNQIGSLMIIESQVIQDLMKSLPTTFSQFGNQKIIKLHEINLNEIFDKFDQFDEEDEVFNETFLNDEEGKKRTISILKSIESQDQTIEDSIELTSNDFLFNEMIDLTKDDHLPNQSDQIDSKRNLIDKMQNNHPKKPKLDNESSINTFENKTNQSTQTISESDKSSSEEEYEIHPFHTSDSINQKVSNLSNQFHQIHQKWLNTLNDLQLDLSCDLEESLVFKSFTFQKSLIDLILISKELNSIKLFIIDYIHQLYS